MIDLNTDYQELKRQCSYIENHFLDCKNANMSALYYSTYRDLAQFYMIATGDNPCRTAVNKNKYVKYTGRDRLNSFYKKKRENFIANRKNHFNMFSSSSFSIVDILEDFMETDYYHTIVSKADLVISDALGQDILDSFLTECDPHMRNLLDEVKEEKRMFVLPPIVDFIDKDGCVCYNPIEDISNIFVSPRKSSLRLLSTIVHELGHVKDLADYTQRYSSLQAGLYYYQTVYAEVLSTYYQYQFYDYLLKNDLYTDSVMREVFEELMLAADFNDHMILLSMLPDGAIREWKYAQEKQTIVNTIMDSSEIPIISLDCSADDHRLVDFNDTLQYGYGSLLSLAMLADSKLYDSFLANRTGYFDMQKLASSGFSIEDTSEKVLKKCENYFGKYL